VKKVLEVQRFSFFDLRIDARFFAAASHVGRRGHRLHPRCRRPSVLRAFGIAHAEPVS